MLNRQAISLVTALLSSAVFAQGPNTPEILYHSGMGAKDQGLQLKNWGSGTISQTDEASYGGAYSLQISTRNYFQGGIMNYANAQDLSTKFDNKNNLLQITFRTADGQTTQFHKTDSGGRSGDGGPGDQGGGGGAGGSLPDKQGNGSTSQGLGRSIGEAGGRQARRGEGGGPGGGGAGGSLGQIGRKGLTSTTATSPLRNIRLIVTTTDGKKSEIYIPVNTSVSEDYGWRSVAIPLQAITGLDRTNKIVKELAFSGDGTATFYVGDLRVVNDSTPITGEIENQNNNFALGDVVTFKALGSGGSSVLKYSWSFDAANSTMTDAIGQTVNRRFRKPGKYHIVLTISDLYGLKQPYTCSMDVTVNG
jgi:hypothetical protein